MELIGKPASATLAPASPELAMKVLAERMALEEAGQGDMQASVTLEQEVLCRDGSTVWTEMRLSFIRDEKNRPASILGVTRDISERRKAEHLVRESEARLRDIIFSIADWVWEVDENGVYTYSSQKGIDLFGEHRGDIIGKTPFDFMPSDEAQRVAAIFSEVSANKLPIKDLENWNIGRNGQRICLLTNGLPIVDERGNLKGYRGVDKDITRRKQMEMQIEKSHAKLRAALGTVISTLTVTVEVRDPYTAGHQKRVAHLAQAIGMEMGWKEDRLEGLWMAGTIHDIGKISVPAEILSKPSRLTPTEISLIQEHSQAGWDILKNVEFSWPIAEIILQHHERMNGSGYPRNLKGDEILMETRILSVADVVEAMVSHRPYRPALGVEAALEEIENNKGILYDPEVVEGCLRLFRQKGFSFE
ncbi:MAG: HD domain-containing phosphohydrolase [Thermodesulfobacteriota bacterium]